MTTATFLFPHGFLWGTATSSYQNEGSNKNSSWYMWEKEPGHILHNQTNGFACDWWNGRWREDFNRAKASYQNTHRLSLEWSRIQPQEDLWDESALDYYRQILQGLSERGLTPFIALHHFSDPLWLSQIGGWENPRVVDYFVRFTEKVVDALAEYCSFWITINEPNVYVVEGYIEGIFPPGKQDLGNAFTVMVNMVKAHAAAYRAIHQKQKKAQVGIAHNYRHFLPESNWNPMDNSIARILHQNFNNSFAKAVHSGNLQFLFRRENIKIANNTQDFIGVNYYTADQVQFNLLRYKKLFYEAKPPKGSELSENKFIANYPRGMTRAIDWARNFKKPIYITENGIEDASDGLRPDYIVQHLFKVWKATNYLIPIKGYFHWTLIDNFEWERGWKQRFGLWELDPTSQRRRPRKSADLYAEICKTNSITSEMVAQYAPASLPTLFPT